MGLLSIKGISVLLGAAGVAALPVEKDQEVTVSHPGKHHSMHFPFEMYHTTVSVKGHPVEVAAGLPDHLSQVATQVEKLCGDAESARQNTGLCDIINAAPQTAAEAKLALPRPTLVATLAADITADTLETVAPTPSRKHPSASGAGTSPQDTEDAGFISFELPEDTRIPTPLTATTSVEAIHYVSTVTLLGSLDYGLVGRGSVVSTFTYSYPSPGPSGAVQVESLYYFRGPATPAGCTETTGAPLVVAPSATRRLQTRSAI